MIQAPAQSRIFIAHEPINFRNGIDGTAAICRSALEQDPMSGAIFVFRNRKSTMLRVFCYDGQGFCLFVKRFSEGKLKWWKSATDSGQILAAELQVLLWGGNPTKSDFKKIWKKIS